jgi:Phage tail assembly chaperone protein, TAC
MSVLPWPDLIAAAPRFGLTPPAFWALSVREWRALVGEGQGLDAGRLAELSAAFPDEEKPLSPKRGRGEITLRPKDPS